MLLVSKGQQHRSHEELIHAVVEAQTAVRDPPVMLFNAHVGPGKECRREPHKRRQRDQKDIERIDEELLVPDQHRTIPNDTQDQE